MGAGVSYLPSVGLLDRLFIEVAGEDDRRDLMNAFLFLAEHLRESLRQEVIARK